MERRSAWIQTCKNDRADRLLDRTGSCMQAGEEGSR